MSHTLARLTTAQEAVVLSQAEEWLPDALEGKKFAQVARK